MAVLYKDFTGISSSVIASLIGHYGLGCRTESCEDSWSFALLMTGIDVLIASLSLQSAHLVFTQDSMMKHWG